MSDALNKDGALRACIPGTFTPLVSRGAVLEHGLLLGHIRCDGRSFGLRVPAGVHGVVARVRGSGEWVQWGEWLVEIGLSTTLDAEEADVDSVDGDVPDGVQVVRADTDGTVYLRPDPAASPFAAQESTVAAQDTLALVEVMKTFSPVRAPCDGQIIRVCVGDGDSVQAGDALFWLGG